MRDAVRSPSGFRPTLVAVAALAATRAHWFCARSKKARTQTRREELIRADGSQREPFYHSAKQRRESDWALEFGVWNLKLNFP